MAATLAIYIGAVAAMPLWIREHLTSPVHATPAFDLAKLNGLGIGPDNIVRVYAQGPNNAWVLSNHVTTSTGQVLTADPQYCGPAQSPQVCEQWLGTQNLRQHLTYHPDSHFWSLQWAETGIFIAAAVLLVGFCFWWIRRRIS
jgi:hypothetical protein